MVNLNITLGNLSFTSISQLKWFSQEVLTVNVTKLQETTDTQLLFRKNEMNQNILV